ncbi:hypothetical protein A7A08_02831 [Methyloligella halotolerans]|uniref:Alginate export domain-containing protein n=1 Tax=Methyloligella halotolerans TaxID=1177755 RepID=A0A1E2RVC3_9HYPH|nr:hypothetical protein [Methyloligella halotolerans]ODA66184.1 hypothetical protein A7A08_02831 [Methyloligella halotolerans]
MKLRGVYATWFRASLLLSFSIAVLALSSLPAAAQYYVRSPEVEKGELKLEEHGALYSGPGEEERRRQSHEVEALYGFTDRFEGIVEGFFVQDIGEDFEFDEVELGGQYELIERHGDGLGLAFRGIYEFALQGGEPDEILFGPLAKYVAGPNSATINTFFVSQLGSDRDIDSLEMKFYWRLKHEFGETFGLGVEGYSEVEDLSNAGSFDDQEHRLGPVAYFEFEDWGPEVELAAGTLFGVSDATSDVTFKLDLELAF